MGPPQGDARELAAFEATGGSGEGRSVLHVTTEGLVLVSERRGVVLDVAWGRLYTATRRGRGGITLTWDSGGGHLTSYGLSSAGRRFVTHNPMFCALEGSAGEEMYDERLPDGSVAVAQEDVEMVHGYPAVRRIWDGDGGSREAWTLLPTIWPEMITTGMARGKILPPGDGGALTYMTDPPGIYAPKFCAPISVHEAVLLNSNMRKYAQSVYRGVIDRLNYLRENVKAGPGGTAGPRAAITLHDAQGAHDDPNFRKWMLEPDA